MTDWKKSFGISQTAIALYRNCPYAYKLKYFNKKQPVMWDFSVLDVGGYAHDAIDRYYRHHYDPTAIKSYEDILTYSYEELANIWDITLKPEQLKQAYICLENHAKWEFENIKNNICTAPLTEVKIAADGFFGIIDYIDLPKNLAIDWKTGKSAYLSYAYRMQAAVYKILYEHEYNMKLTHFKFFFLYPNEWRTVRYDSPKQQQVEHDVVTLKNAIEEARENDIFPKQPRTPKACNSCEYRNYCGGNEEDDEEEENIEI